MGQHFLTDPNIARNIVDLLQPEPNAIILEIGPGEGVLTKILLEKYHSNFYAIEVDREAYMHVSEAFPKMKKRIIHADFLKFDFAELPEGPIYLIGNFPYNISSQILFKTLDYKDRVIQCVGMFQKEMADRVGATHGNKTFGILSVLMQSYYDVKKAMDVPPHVFRPPPAVNSTVLKIYKKDEVDLPCTKKDLFRVVKMGFNQRRKTLRNSLRSLLNEEIIGDEIFNQRPEQLSVAQFHELTALLFPKTNQAN